MMNRIKKATTPKESQKNVVPKEVYINTKKLKKVRLPGAWVPGFIHGICGFLDRKRGLLDVEQTKSPWIVKRQALYDTYTSRVLTVAGELFKDCFLQRELIADQIKLLHKEMLETRESIPDEESLGLQEMDVQEAVKTKRQIASAKARLSRSEKELTEKVGELKVIKNSLEEAQHELDQLLLDKNRIVTAQIGSYLRAARLRSTGDVLQECQISRDYFHLLGDGFTYEVDIEKLINGKKANEREER